MTLATQLSLTTMKSLENGVAAHFGATPLWSIRAVSQALSQRGRYIDADAWCKLALRRSMIQNSGFSELFVFVSRTGCFLGSHSRWWKEHKPHSTVHLKMTSARILESTLITAESRHRIKWHWMMNCVNACGTLP